MADYPASARRLIAALRQLPSVGPRTAERLALHILREEKSIQLASAIQEAKTNIRSCSECGFFSEEETCEICRDTQRDPHLFCIVESPSDVLTFEKTASFRGLYHVLHGTLSPLDGRGPEEIGIPRLLERLEKLQAREVILGLSPDVRGETTSIYIGNELKKRNIIATRLATGISVGSGLEFVDSATLSHALADRKPL